MAEVRRKEKVEKYNIEEIVTKKGIKTKEKKEVVKKKTTNKKVSKEEKKNLWVRFRIFCHGVKSEAIKVHWTGKKDVLKYSIATIFFIVFCSLFFYLINVVFALIQLIFK